jgi:hypothetical protein
MSTRWPSEVGELAVTMTRDFAPAKFQMLSTAESVAPYFFAGFDEMGVSEVSASPAAAAAAAPAPSPSPPPSPSPAADPVPVPAHHSARRQLGRQYTDGVGVWNESRRRRRRRLTWFRVVFRDQLELDCSSQGDEECEEECQRGDEGRRS